ncbi:hypothetical protein [Bradyrhizobium sp.]|uniref:hypothetical protein n=1 Tax=Bradyrhizobium sp. TaxID=376 RepID=UPI0039E4D9F5
MPQTNDPKPDTPRADGDLTRAYEQIKSAEEDLARLDRLVSGMERGNDGPSASPASASAEPASAPAPAQTSSSPQSEIPHQAPKAKRTMLRAVVGLLLAAGLLGAAFASQYRDQARAIMARWAPPASNTSRDVAEAHGAVTSPKVQLAAADDQVPVPAPPVHKDAESNSPAAVTPPDPKSAELAQSLKAVTDQLASMNDKLEQLKSRQEQTVREQAETIQQLRTAQEKDAADSARLAAQVQALQTQLTALSASSSSSKSAAVAPPASAPPSASSVPPPPAPAKPVARSVVRESEANARQQHVQAAPPRRLRPPREPWMPPPYVIDPYGDPYW